MGKHSGRDAHSQSALGSTPDPLRSAPGPGDTDGDFRCTSLDGEDDLSIEFPLAGKDCGPQAKNDPVFWRLVRVVQYSLCLEKNNLYKMSENADQERRDRCCAFCGVS